MPKTIRLLLYGYEYPPLGGGVSNALKNILKQFSSKDSLTIDFITSSLDNKFSIEQLYPNITMHRVPVGLKREKDFHTQTPLNMFRYTWHSYWLTWNLIRRHRYDFNHFFGLPGGLVSLMFRWKMKYMISLRGVDVPGHSQSHKHYYLLYRPLSRLIWKYAHKVITNSQKLADSASKTAPNVKIDIITNGVDTNSISPVDEKEKFDTFSITSGGTRLIAVKGLDYLIRGYAKFHREHNDSQLILIGSGKLENRLKELSNELGVKDSVQFLGIKPHSWIKKNLPRFHVYCLTSLNEGMSNSMMEAAAAGLPLVVTDVGGVDEILQNNGLLIRKRNIDDIYLNLKKFYLNEEMRIQMGRKSREIASKMSWHHIAGQYYEAYLEMVRQKSH